MTALPLCDPFHHFPPQIPTEKSLRMVLKPCQARAEAVWQYLREDPKAQRNAVRYFRGEIENNVMIS